jgi:Zn-finger domain-containing protein
VIIDKDTKEKITVKEFSRRSGIPLRTVYNKKERHDKIKKIELLGWGIEVIKPLSDTGLEYLRAMKMINQVLKNEKSK